MSLRSAPTGVWRYAKCVCVHDVPTYSRERGQSGNVQTAESPGTLSKIVFSTCSTDGDIPTSSLSLDFSRSVFHAAMEHDGDSTLPVEQVLRSPTAWFTDDAMNLGIGCLWAGLLPARSFRSTPNSASTPQQLAGPEGNCMFLCTLCWGSAARLANLAPSNSPTAAIPPSDVQSEKEASAPRGDSKRRRGTISRSGQDAKAPRSPNPGKVIEPDAVQDEGEQNVEFVDQKWEGSASENMLGNCRNLRRVIGKMVANTFHSTASGASDSNLLHAAQCHDIDILIFPAHIHSNHWFTVVVVGLRSLADRLLQSNCQPLDEVDKQPTTHTRIVILDSMGGGDLLEAKSNIPRKRKAGTRKGARYVADVVLHLLANEWILRLRNIDDLSLRSGSDASEASRFSRELQEKVTFLSKRVKVSMPPVPRQKDTNQCGPMALLAMEALCHDPLFRQFCLEFEELSVDTDNDGSNQHPSDSYVFEDSFELRCRLLRIVEEGRCVAKANIMACKVHT